MNFSLREKRKRKRTVFGKKREKVSDKIYHNLKKREGRAKEEEREEARSFIFRCTYARVRKRSGPRVSLTEYLFSRETK